MIFFDLRTDVPHPRVTEDGRVACVPAKRPAAPTSSVFLAPVALKPRGSSEVENDATMAPCARAKETTLEKQFDTRIQLQDSFPLYSEAKDAPDYSLATYMYWMHLHCDPALYLNDVHLKPKALSNALSLSDSLDHTSTVPVTVSTDKTATQRLPCSGSENALRCLRAAGIELPAADRYDNSLWRFLQRRLHYKLELPYLFSPEYGEDNFYGMIGFLNHPDALQHGSSDDGPSGGRPPRVCETGVLLYHKGRLINRVMHPMPALPGCFVPPDTPLVHSNAQPNSVFSSFALTAVLNVPDFLLPRATKEEFVCESDLAMHVFYDKVDVIITEYLNVYRDEAALKVLQQRYVGIFDTYREARWNERSSSTSAVPHPRDNAVSTGVSSSAGYSTGTAKRGNGASTGGSAKRFAQDSQTLNSVPGDNIWPSSYSSPIPRRRSAALLTRREMPEAESPRLDAKEGVELRRRNDTRQPETFDESNATLHKYDKTRGFLRESSNELSLANVKDESFSTSQEDDDDNDSASSSSYCPRQQPNAENAQSHSIGRRRIRRSGAKTPGSYADSDPGGDLDAKHKETNNFVTKRSARRADVSEQEIVLTAATADERGRKEVSPGTVSGDDTMPRHVDATKAAKEQPSSMNDAEEQQVNLKRRSGKRRPNGTPVVAFQQPLETETKTAQEPTEPAAKKRGIGDQHRDSHEANTALQRKRRVVAATPVVDDNSSESLTPCEESSHHETDHLSKKTPVTGSSDEKQDS